MCGKACLSLKTKPSKTWRAEGTLPEDSVRDGLQDLFAALLLISDKSQGHHGVTDMQCRWLAKIKDGVTVCKSDLTCKKAQAEAWEQAHTCMHWLLNHSSTSLSANSPFGQSARQSLMASLMKNYGKPARYLYDDAIGLSRYLYYDIWCYCRQISGALKKIQQGHLTQPKQGKLADRVRKKLTETQTSCETVMKVARIVPPPPRYGSPKRKTVSPSFKTI